MPVMKQYQKQNSKTKKQRVNPGGTKFVQRRYLIK